MPIIIQRQPDPPVASANDDWDKAAGMLVMLAAAAIALYELFFEGLILALTHWEPVVKAVQETDLVEVKNAVALLVLHTMVFGLGNMVLGWGIYAKAKWAFFAAPAVNLTALVAEGFWLSALSMEQTALAVLVSVFCAVRLAGMLGPKP